MEDPIKLKLNARFRKGDKQYVGCNIYTQDKQELLRISEELGIGFSSLMRSLLNDVVEGKIVVEL